MKKHLKRLKRIQEIKNPKKILRHAVLSLIAGILFGATAGLLSAAF